MPRTITLHCSRTQRLEWPASAAPPATWASGARLWVADLASLRPATGRFMAALDAAETARAQRFRFADDRERFILGHGMLREVLGRLLGARPGALAFGRGPHGKPFIPGSPLRFSFSDTKDAVAVAVAHGTEIGVDLETLARTVDHEAVAGHYFTEAEVGLLRMLPEAERKRGFLELWTRKEAVLKATGVGIMDDLRTIAVLEAANTTRIAHPEMVRMAEPAYHVRSWALGEAHVASLASPVPLEAEWASFTA